jgi:Fucose-binding lectin II (PA-IIL)
MNETVVYLPFDTYVVIQAFVSAAWMQKATFTPRAGEGFGFEGNGDDNAEIGKRAIVTPEPEEGQPGFAVALGVQHDPGGGWVASQLLQGRQYAVGDYSLICVVSEDSNDDDWNDCVVLFSWSTPPGFGGTAEAAD